MNLKLLLALLPLAAHAQTQLSGRVLDAQTHQPVPYASLTVPGTTQGTTANAEGEFVLTVRQLPAKVLAFSLSYGRDSATVAQPGQALAFSLAPAPIQLPGAEPPSYAAELITRAYRVLQHSYGRQLYGQALYRQISTLDQRPTQVLEMCWQARGSSTGLHGTRLDQGRFAEKKGNLISINNLSAFTRAIVLYDTRTDSTKFSNVLSASPTAHYTLHLLGISQGSGQQLAEVAFEEKDPEPASRHVKGILTIATDTYQVLRYRVGQDMPVRSNNPTFKFRDSRMSCDFVFAPRPGGTIPDHYTVTLDETIGRLLKPDVHLLVVGTTYFYAWQPTAPAVAYEPASSKVKDLDTIKQLPYDPAFWRDNPVVKRTPQEEAAVQSFEHEKAFGTMLNK